MLKLIYNIVTTAKAWRPGNKTVLLTLKEKELQIKYCHTIGPA